MFKLLSITLISFVGMNYANNSNNNIKYQSSTPVVVGGVDYQDITNDFIIPSAYYTFYYDGPTVPSQGKYYDYNFGFTFSADYIYFTYYGSYSTMFDTRDTDYFNLISYYSIAITVNENTGSFTWRVYGYDSDNNQLFQNLICYYTADNGNDLNGLERFYNDLNNYVFYVHNFHFNSYYRHNFTGFNGDTMETINLSRNNTKLPFDIDNRYHSLEKYFYFPYEPVTYGYWYKTLGTYYLDRTLGSVGSISRPTIFNGYFKNQGRYYSKYQLDGINAEQPANISGTNGWYFGPYNDVTSLSSPKVVKPSSGSQFWIAQNGLFTTFNNTITPVWYTLYTPVTSSGTTVNVLSDSYQWYSSFYQEIYLVYEVVDTNGNLTAINDLSYYDMLSFNTGFISNPGVNVDPFTSALTLVGVAFQRVWSIGNIVLFGSITLNTLILMPILVGLVIFVIHLIKKG